jgi:CRP/FNR family transcriptional regulator
MQPENILTHFDFYQDSPISFQQELVESSTLVNLKSEDFFYHEGGLCSHFAMVGTGSIRVFKLSETGRQITLYRVKDGQICLVNVMSLLLNNPVPASAQAETSLSALVVPGQKLRGWIDQQDALREYVFSSLSQCLVDTLTLVEATTFHGLRRRLSKHLLELFNSSDGATPNKIKTTHQDIATEMGSTREVISRTLRELEDAGAISLGRANITLLNEAQLSRLVG